MIKCVDLTRYSFLEIFFPLHVAPPQNPNLKLGCPIPLARVYQIERDLKRIK